MGVNGQNIWIHGRWQDNLPPHGTTLMIADPVYGTGDVSALAELSYSRFVEAIACYGVRFYGDLHWSNRTGIFTDYLFSNKEHPWKKPEPLIERLIRNHYPGHGIVYDPCAGSGTVDTVCKRLGIPSFSVEIGDGIHQ